MRQLVLICIEYGKIIRYKQSQIMLPVPMCEAIMAEKNPDNQMGMFDQILRQMMIPPAYETNIKIIREWLQQKGASVCFRG